MSVKLWLRMVGFALLALVALGALGGGALASRNLFNTEDYRDCPSRTRLQALSNVRVARTDEEDELQVTWDMTQPAGWNLGNNVYTASITVILESEDKTITSEKALGSTSATFEDLAQSTDWLVQVAVTDRGYVISDIVEDKITSSAPAPVFDTPLYHGRVTTQANFDMIKKDGKVGRFYYLGFNKEFANWYVTHDNGSEGKADLTPKFRVGLDHRLVKASVEEVEFDHFRVRVVDSGGDDVLGFDAATVANNLGFTERGQNFRNQSPAYENNGRDQGLTWAVRNLQASDFGSGGKYASSSDAIHFANYARSNKMDKGGAPAIRSLFVPATAYALGMSATNAVNANTILEQTKTALSFVKVSDRFPNGSEFANGAFWAFGPSGVYDMPADIFAEDDNYTITGWLENEDDEQISPRTSITFSARMIASIPKTARLFKSTNGGSTWASAAYTGMDDVRAYVLTLTILDNTNDKGWDGCIGRQCF